MNIKTNLTALLTLCVAMSASAQRNRDNDSIIQILDEMGVPLVEKSYVANSSFVDNWSLALYGGFSTNWGSDMSHISFFRNKGVTSAITLGKDVTPLSSVRLQLNYVRNTGVTDNQFTDEMAAFNHKRYKWNSYGLNVDYMLNFTNLILGFRENRKFHFYGVVGVGGSVSRNYTTGDFVGDMDNSHGQQVHNNDKYDNRQHSLVNIRAGLASAFYLSRNWSLCVEAVGSLLDNSYDSNPTSENTWDGHVDFQVGIKYRFNNKGGQAPGFYYPRHDMTVYRQRLKEIGDLRDKTNKRLKDLEDMADTIDVDAKVIYTLIAFDEGQAEVDRLQQTNLYTTALAWSRDTKSLIFITNSSGVDDRLFRRRVKEIVNILTERYEIPVHKIRVFANEKDIQTSYNYIECIIND